MCMIYIWALCAECSFAPVYGIIGLASFSEAELPVHAVLCSGVHYSRNAFSSSTNTKTSN